jgi:hypothetical protein
MASLGRNVSVVLATGERLVLDFTGQANGSVTAMGAQFSMALSFGMISTNGAIKITIDNSDKAPLSGSIKLGNETLGTLTENGAVWDGACAGN